MNRSERIAHGLIAVYGPEEAFWMMMRRVRGWVCDGTAPERVAFWRSVREVCYRQWRKAAFHGAGVWT
jgi:hypothetical protein